MPTDPSPHPSQFSLWDVFAGVLSGAGLLVPELVADVKIWAMFDAPRASTPRLSAPDKLTNYMDSVKIVPRNGEIAEKTQGGRLQGCGDSNSSRTLMIGWFTDSRRTETRTPSSGPPAHLTPSQAATS